MILTDDDRASALPDADHSSRGFDRGITRNPAHIRSLFDDDDDDECDDSRGKYREGTINARSIGDQCDRVPVRGATAAIANRSPRSLENGTPFKRSSRVPCRLEREREKRINVIEASSLLGWKNSFLFLPPFTYRRAWICVAAYALARAPGLREHAILSKRRLN